VALPENIKKLRGKLGLHQSQLASKVGVAQSSVCDWESGKTSPRLERLERLAEVLGVSLQRLLS
jgi:transcriptional regulator with XRE-family HTH domain